MRAAVVLGGLALLIGLSDVMAQRMDLPKNNADDYNNICEPSYTPVSDFCVKISNASDSYTTCGILNDRAIDLATLLRTPELMNAMEKNKVAGLWLPKEIIHSPKNARMMEQLKNDWKSDLKTAISKADMAMLDNCFLYDPKTKKVQLIPCPSKFPQLCVYNPTKNQLMQLGCPAGQSSLIYPLNQFTCYTVDPVPSTNGAIPRAQLMDKFQFFVYTELIKGLGKGRCTIPKADPMTMSNCSLRHVANKNYNPPTLRLQFEEDKGELSLFVENGENILRSDDDANHGISCMNVFANNHELILHNTTQTRGKPKYNVALQSSTPRNYYCRCRQAGTLREIRSQAVLAYKKTQDYVFAVEWNVKLSPSALLELATGEVGRTRAMDKTYDIVKLRTITKDASGNSGCLIHVEVPRVLNKKNITEAEAFNNLVKTSASYKSQIPAIKSLNGCILNDTKIKPFEENMHDYQCLKYVKEKFNGGKCVGNRVLGGQWTKSKNECYNTYSSANYIASFKPMLFVLATIVTYISSY